MPVQVPKLEQPQRPIGESLIPTALSSILWPMRMQAAQEAIAQKQAGVEAGTTDVLRDTLRNNPELLSKLAPTGTPTDAGQTPSPSSMATGMAPSDIENILQTRLPKTGIPGTSTRMYENILSEFGQPGGKVKPTPSFTGYGPQGEQQSTMVAPGVGATVAKAPQVATGITPEGGQQLVPKVPGTVLSTPEGEAARKSATAMPSPYTDLRKSVLMAGGSPKDVVTQWFQLQEKVRGSFPRPSAMPPGVYFDGATKKFRDAEGNPLTTDEVQGLEYAYQEGQPTTSFKTMQQRALPALDLVRQTRTLLNGMAPSGLGPLAGRLRDFTQGRIGAADPDFNSLRTLTTLLTTQVSAAHIGLRPPIQVMQKFDQLTDITHQDPENINAALDTIDKYLTDLAKPRYRGSKGQPPLIPGQTGEAPGATAAPASAPFAPLPGETYDQYKARAAAAGVK